MADTVAIILAAGRSTRMKSEVPKVLHRVCGRLLIDYVLDAARAAGARRLIVVVGHRADLVRQALAGHPDVEFAEQQTQQGTGHAVMMCIPHLTGHDGSVLILNGDTPLLQGTSLQALLDVQRAEGAASVIGTADTANNHGLGRIVRDASGRFLGIVEEKDATTEQRRITEINTGCYAFRGPLLISALQRLQPNNRQSEYYLTDCPKILMDQGHPVTARCSLTIEEALGVNTRVQLAEVRATIQRSILNELMLGGVTIEDPAQTVIDAGVQVGPDTVIRAFSVIESGVTIGARCTIGPHAWLTGAVTVADNTRVGPVSDRLIHPA